eukprot:g30051.t1
MAPRHKALQLATALRSKGQGPPRKALQGLKQGLYHEVLEALSAGAMSFPGRVVCRHVILLFAVCLSDESCSNEACSAKFSEARAKETGMREEFWAEIQRQGLQLHIRRKIMAEKAFGGLPARNRTAMVLSDDVFYGRAIMKIPRQALITVETGRNDKLKSEMTRFLFEEMTLQKVFNITSPDYIHLLSLAYTLLAERRDADSVFIEWDLIWQTAPNLTFFKRRPVSMEEASWALAVIMRHGRVVHPYQDQREVRDPRMYIFPLPELLDVALHPNPGVSIGFQEEIVINGKREEDLLVMALSAAPRWLPLAPQGGAHSASVFQAGSHSSTWSWKAALAAPVAVAATRIARRAVAAPKRRRKVELQASSSTGMSDMLTLNTCDCDLILDTVVEFEDLLRPNEAMALLEAARVTAEREGWGVATHKKFGTQERGFARRQAERRIPDQHRKIMSSWVLVKLAWREKGRTAASCMELDDQRAFRVQKAQAIPFAGETSSGEARDALAGVLTLLEDHFYFSHDFDITRRLQRRVTVQASQLHHHVLSAADPRFVWNSGLCTSLLGQGIGERWFTPVMQVIHQAANWVETEMLAKLPGMHWLSLTQVRGSAPVFWEQKSSSSAVTMTRGLRFRRFVCHDIARTGQGTPLTALGFNKHQAWLSEEYGRVFNVSLLSRASSKRDTEGVLREALENQLRRQNATLIRTWNDITCWLLLAMSIWALYFYEIEATWLDAPCQMVDISCLVAGIVTGTAALLELCAVFIEFSPKKLSPAVKGDDSKTMLLVYSCLSVSYFKMGVSGNTWVHTDPLAFGVAAQLAAMDIQRLISQANVPIFCVNKNLEVEDHLFSNLLSFLLVP